jgi:predicted RNA-binding protein associated with RNAse of E/G family
MDDEELTRRREHIDELARRLKRGDITQEFYDKAFQEQYEIEKKYGLLKPGSWLWDEMLDDLNEYNKKSSKEAKE